MGGGLVKNPDIIDGVISIAQKNFVGCLYVDKIGGISILEFLLEVIQERNIVGVRHRSREEVTHHVKSFEESIELCFWVTGVTFAVAKVLESIGVNML